MLEYVCIPFVDEGEHFDRDRRGVQSAPVNLEGRAPEYMMAAMYYNTKKQKGELGFTFP
jgi:hypothetical protein